MTKAPYFLIWVAMERRLYHLHTEIRIGHFYTGLTGLEEENSILKGFNI